MPIVAPAATPTAVASGTGDAQGVAATTNLRLYGYSIRENAGSAAAAAVSLRHGTTSSDALLAVEEIPADGSVTRWFGPGGIACASGIFVDRVSGTTELVLYTAAVAA